MEQEWNFISRIIFLHFYGWYWIFPIYETTTNRFSLVTWLVYITNKQPKDVNVPNHLDLINTVITIRIIQR